MLPKLKMLALVVSFCGLAVAATERVVSATDKTNAPEATVSNNAEQARSQSEECRKKKTRPSNSVVQTPEPQSLERM